MTNLCLIKNRWTQHLYALYDNLKSGDEVKFMIKSKKLDEIIIIGDKFYYVKKDKEGNIIDVTFDSPDEEKMAAIRFIELLESADNSYEKYVNMVNDEAQTQEVQNHIIQNKEAIIEYKDKFGI